MNSNRDPAELTQSERLRELAGILAAGMLRLRELRRRTSPSPTSPSHRTKESPASHLDVARKTVLSGRG